MLHVGHIAIYIPSSLQDYGGCNICALQDRRTSVIGGALRPKLEVVDVILEQVGVGHSHPDLLYHVDASEAQRTCRRGGRFSIEAWPR